MHFHVHATEYRARLDEPEEPDTFVIVEGWRTNMTDGAARIFDFTLTKEEFGSFFGKLIDVADNWPTEPPPEAPTAEDEQGLNHGQSAPDSPSRRHARGL